MKRSWLPWNRMWSHATSHRYYELLYGVMSPSHDLMTYMKSMRHPTLLSTALASNKLNSNEKLASVYSVAARTLFFCHWWPPSKLKQHKAKPYWINQNSWNTWNFLDSSTSSHQLKLDPNVALLWMMLENLMCNMTKATTTTTTYTKNIQPPPSHLFHHWSASTFPTVQQTNTKLTKIEQSMIK